MIAIRPPLENEPTVGLLPPSRWRTLALCILLCYPIMASKWFPFGGGPRYLSVLVGPLCLALLWQTSRRMSLRPLLLEVRHWCLPFIPLVAGWVVAQLWHGYAPPDITPLKHLLLSGLLYAGARLVGVNHRQLTLVAAVGAVAYGVIALVEVYGMGRARAWGGVYENRFGQYAAWLAALCALHFFFGDARSRWPGQSIWLPIAGLFGLSAAWLSGSRGAFSLVPVLLCTMMFANLSRRRGAVSLLVVALAMGGAAYVSAPMFQRFELGYQEVVQYFREPVFSPTSIGIRLELARVSLLTWHEHPWLGAGYTSLQQLYARHPSLGVPHPEILRIPGFHSDWFQAIGIGGGLLLASLLGTCGCLMWARRRNLYCLSFLGFAVAFSFGELFFTHGLGLGLLMACWALYSAAELNQRPSAP